MSGLQLGWRRETLLLLPVTAVALIGFVLFVLFSYRNVVVGQVEEARATATRQLSRAVLELTQAQANGERPGDRLHALVQDGGGAAILDARGRLIATAGRIPEAGLLEPLATAGTTPDQLSGFLVIGPDRRVGPVIAAFARLPQSEGRPLVLRIDQPARFLGGHLRALPVLVTVALGISVLLFVLVVLFLRHLVRPFDELMRRARTLQTGTDPAPNRELEFLVDAFDRALATLRHPAPESELAALERTLGYSLNTGVMILDEGGRCVALNPRGAELLGLDSAELVLPCALAVLLVTRPEVARLLGDALAGGHGLERVECRISGGEAERTIGFTFGPLRRPDGSARGWIALFADLTRALEDARQERVAQGLETLAELTAGLAHEMRNALASLQGYVTLIQRQDVDAQLAEDLSQLRLETDQLQRLLDDFLSFARPGQVQLGEVSVARLLHRAASDPALGGAAVRVRLQDGVDGLAVRGDQHLLQRAIRNLLLNAVEAERAHGDAGLAVPITLSAQRGASGLTVLVEDHGSGIPDPEDPDRLFVPFASGRAGGTGLGLSISRRIADLHGAVLSLGNRPGGGARAELRFPPDRIVTKGNESKSLTAEV
jgi:signal transduction histidine kinase